MTHDEMIAVIQAHKEGKPIEGKRKDKEIWFACNAPGSPSWDFDAFDYRVAEPKWLYATIDDLKRAPVVCRFMASDGAEWRSGTLIGWDHEPPHWRVKDDWGDIHWWAKCQVQDTTS